MAVVALLAGTIALGQHERKPYTRYVSPPLADGTRFTFLYPSLLTAEEIMWHHNNSWLEHGDGTDGGAMFVVQDRSRVDQFLRRFSIYTKTFPPNNEQFDVQFSALPKTPPDWAGTEDRHGDYWSSDNIFVHDAEVTQAITGRDFMLEHSDSDHSRTFDAHDKIFVESFQILLSGAPVPK